MTGAAWLGAIGFLVGTAATGVSAGEGFHWQRDDSSVALLNHDTTVWRFTYGSTHGKPFFHPLALTDGTVLTWDRPRDHPWHHGLWFCWKYINNVNYWEEDRETGISAGRTLVEKAAVETRDDFSAVIQLTLTYHPAGKPVVLREDRTISVSTPDEAGGYTLDWDHEFTAVADLELDRTPPPGERGGKRHGGYAGFSIRVSREMEAWRVIGADGTAGMKLHAHPASAADISGVIQGREAGVAVVDHPSNLNALSRWYVVLKPETPFGYLSPAVIFSNPHSMAKGERLHLRYRAVVHPGRWGPEDLRREAERFREAEIPAKTPNAGRYLPMNPFERIHGVGYAVSRRQ